MLSEYVKPLKIGNVQLKNNIIAAPIAGFSDFAYRKICRDFGAGLTVTELTSAKGLFYQSKGTTELLYSIEDSPKGIINDILRNELLKRVCLYVLCEQDLLLQQRSRERS